MQSMSDLSPLAVANLQNLLFQTLTLRDVSHETGKKPARLQLHLTHRQVHRKHRAILALPYNLAANPNNARVPSSSVIRKITVMLAPIWIWHKRADIAPNKFLRLIAEDFLRGSIYRFDHTALINGDDSLHSCVQDRAQALFAITQRRLMSLPFDGALGGLHCV